MESGPSPTAPSERIVSLDVLRGFALLGILLINIWVFAMPFAVLQNPTAYGDLTGANYLAWLVSHIFAQEKFITLFTMLFGTGIILFTRSKPDRKALTLHYRRMAILLAIGLAHAYLLWYGDILVQYALCGLFVVAARDWDTTTLARYGLLFVAVPTILSVVQGLSLPPTATIPGWEPSAAAIASEVETYRSGWLAQLDHRASTALLLQTSGFIAGTFWRITGLMLWGMALFKSGILSNQRSTAFYRRLLVAAGGAGLALVLTGVWYNTTVVDWAGRESVYFGAQFNYWGSALLAVAYIAAVMLYCRWRTDGPVITALSAVGRTALSNYLLQTVLATSIFYGHGLGLFGTLNRVELLGVVTGIWTVQIVLSIIWVRYFKFGPVEWLWRIGTYGRRQPLRKRT